MSQNRILIIEDNAINIDVLQINLGEEYELKVAITGAEGLGEVSSFNPDIILLDIMMPGMDGYKVCCQIRSSPGYRFIKIIMVSVKAMPSEQLEGFKAGADDYIVKPFKKEDLKSKIRYFLKLKFQEEMNQIKNTYLLSLSDSTNKPLNTISEYSDLLLQMENLDETQKKYIQILRKAGKDLEKFIHKASMLTNLSEEDIKNKQL